MDFYIRSYLQNFSNTSSIKKNDRFMLFLLKKLSSKTDFN